MGKVHINSITLESYISIILQENTNIIGKGLFDPDYCHYLPQYSFSKWCVNTAQTIKVHKRDIFLLLNKCYVNNSVNTYIQMIRHEQQLLFYHKQTFIAAPW